MAYRWRNCPPSLLLILGLADSTLAAAYSIIVYLPQLIGWIILRVWALSRTDMNLRQLVMAIKTYFNNDQKASQTKDG